MPKLTNQSKQYLVFNLEHEAHRINMSRPEVVFTPTGERGVRRVTRSIGGALRLQPGETVNVPPTMLECVEIKQAIRQGLVVVVGEVKTPDKKPPQGSGGDGGSKS